MLKVSYTHGNKMVVQCLCSGTRFYRDSPVRFETMNEHGSKGHDQTIAKVIDHFRMSEY